MGTRKIVNIALPLAGLAVVVFYNFCGSTCTFLKGGFLGIDLKYLGLAYPVLLLLLVLLKQDLPSSRLALTGRRHGDKPCGISGSETRPTAPIV